MANNSTYSEWSVESLKKFISRAQDLRAGYISAYEAAGRFSPVEVKSNRKLNGIATFSTVPIIDCGKACRDCSGGCYAVRHVQGRVINSLKNACRNSARLAVDRVRFFEDLKRAARLEAFFRFHEAGEVIDMDYFCRCIELVSEVPTCQFLMFTKRYDIVNDYIDAGGVIPENMHLLLSAWSSVGAVPNPHKLPISAPDFSGAPAKYRRDFDPAGLRVIECGGDCSACAVTGSGCWGAKGGDCIKFIAH